MFIALDAWPPRLVSLALLHLMVLVCLVPAAASAQTPSPGEELVLRALPIDANTFVPPRKNLPMPRGAALTTFNVTYNGFTPAARNAFQAAVDIWAQIVSSPVPIEVEANWTPLDENVLGNARAHRVWSGGSLPPGESFPDALADAILGGDVCALSGQCPAGDSDIIANFSSTFNWYLGTDGNAPPGQHDLVTVVLHELGHGLGFTGGMLYDDGEGSGDDQECNGVAGTGCYGSSPPLVYNSHVESPLGVPILNYASPSAALGSALTNSNVNWVGTNGSLANGGFSVPLYSPSTFEPGSSYSHLDESSFPTGDPDSLMTPFLAQSEAIHDPGSIARGIFVDMGWTVSASQPAGCVGRATSLSLQNGRFLVSGMAFLRGQPSTFFLQNICTDEDISKTAAAFYFNAGAVPVQEGFISIRNECNSGRFAWIVEVASASTRRFWVDVLDTATGLFQRYENPNGGSSSFFPADSSSFAESCLVP